jgi:hypothetical protein
VGFHSRLNCALLIEKTGWSGNDDDRNDGKVRVRLQSFHDTESIAAEKAQVDDNCWCLFASIKSPMASVAKKVS